MAKTVMWTCIAFRDSGLRHAWTFQHVYCTRVYCMQEAALDYLGKRGTVLGAGKAARKQYAKDLLQVRCSTHACVYVNASERMRIVRACVHVGGMLGLLHGSFCFSMSSILPLYINNNTCLVGPRNGGVQGLCECERMNSKHPSCNMRETVVDPSACTLISASSCPGGREYQKMQGACDACKWKGTLLKRFLQLSAALLTLVDLL